MFLRPAIHFTALALAAAAPLAAQAVDYPARPIKIVVPFPPGGSSDALARILAERMGKLLGQPTVVDNKPGASEQIAISGVTKAAADGYTILLSTVGGLTVNPALYGPRLTYNPQKDLAPIALVAATPSVVVVHPSVPVKNMAELGVYLKSQSGEKSYASAGNGTTSHLGMEYYKRANGVDTVHVPYKGGAPALQDLMGGQVQVMMALVPEAMPMVKAGRLRALAVTTSSRMPAYPEIPTVGESGGKDFDVTFWWALFAPTGTPPEVLAKLNHTVNTILGEKDTQTRLGEMSLDVLGGAPSKVAELITTDSAKWKKVIDDANIKLD